MALPLDQGPQEFNRWIQSELKSIIEHSAFSRRDVENFNADLPQRVRGFVSERRDQLKKQGQLLEALAIPLRRTSSQVTPLPMPKRVLKPLPPPRAVEQEYTIGLEDYEYILNIIRHQSRSFEQTPAAYRKLEEEELRDVVLSSLNTHLEGDASGERFRRKGKTDICVEYNNRAAFVAECKIWGGPKAASAAVDQLLGYLTWRDCRAATLLFNKTVKEFKALQDGFVALLAGHALFVKHLSSGQHGEWRAVFRAADDPGRLVTVHFFLIDLPSGEPRRPRLE